MIKCFMYIDPHLNYSYTVAKIEDLVTTCISTSYHPLFFNRTSTASFLLILIEMTEIITAMGFSI